MRRTMPRVEMEEKAIQAATVLAIGKEVQAAMPISDEVLQEHWIKPFVDGDPHIMMHLEVNKRLHNK